MKLSIFLSNNFLFWFIVICIISSCGTYRYYEPRANTALFKDEGELQIAGDIGLLGASVKYAYSLTDHFGIMGQYNRGAAQYRVKEGELAAGYHATNGNRAIFLSLGTGWGSNFEYGDSSRTIVLYEGNFIRPFVQFNSGITEGSLFKVIKTEAIFVLKGSYFVYNGRHLDGSGDKIQSSYFLFEPAMTMGLGSKGFRFNFSYGLPLHLSVESLSSRSNARTFPLNVGIGLRFIIGRD